MNWIEKYILLTLTQHKVARAKDLAPENIEQNLLTYYLKRLIASSYIYKVKRGVYGLTTAGERLAGSFSTLTGKQTDNLKTCIVLFSKTSDKEYLLFDWKRQPYFGKVSLLSDRMKFGDYLKDALNNAMLEKLGEIVEAKYLTQGIVRVSKDGDLVSHMHIFAYYVDVSRLTFPIVSRNGEAILCDLVSDRLIGGMQKVLQAIESKMESFDLELLY